MLDSKLDHICQEHACIGLSAIITSKDKILKEYYYGYASIEEDIETSNKSIYRMASVSKVVVAVAIMLLYDQGKLFLDDDVSKYLGYIVRNPYYPEDKITIKMLMTHTSSIYDAYGEEVGYSGTNNVLSYVELKRLLTDPSYEYYSSNTFLKERPGTKFCYSNFGTGILACIIEKITGVYFTDFVNDNIFHVLNMNASFRVDEINDKDNIASLYTLNNNEFYLMRDKHKFADFLFPRYKLGNNFRGVAGGMFVGLKDLTKFMMMLIKNGAGILKTNTVKMMEEICWKDDSVTNSIYKQKGLQLLILDGYGDRLYGHLGEAYGLRSFMLFNENYGYLLACNGARYKKVLDDFSLLQSQFLEEMIKFTKELGE